MNKKRYEYAKKLHAAGLMSDNEWIYECWVAGLLIWDEAIDLIVRIHFEKIKGGKKA